MVKKKQTDPKTCANCRFFHLDDPKDEIGFCRRMPPVYIPSDEDGAGGGWTFAVTWFDVDCGEHKPVEQ
jgi:hypothetical protein